MADDLSVALERLRTSTERLNKIADSASETIREVESYLDDLKVGVYANVEVATLWDEEDDRDRTEIRLCYLRTESGKFRVAVEVSKYTEDHLRDEELKTWSECSRDNKLRTFEKLPALLIEIAKCVDDRVATAEKTVTDVSARLPLPKSRKGGEK